MKIAKQIAEEAVEMYKQDRKNKIPSTTFEPVVPVVYIKAAVEKVLRELEIPERPADGYWEKKDMWDAWHKAIYGEEKKVKWCEHFKGESLSNLAEFSDGTWTSQTFKADFCPYCAAPRPDANKPTEPKPELPEKLPTFMKDDIRGDNISWWNRETINKLIDYLKGREK